MGVIREGVKDKRRSRSLATSIRATVLLIFSMWVLLVLSQLRFSPVVHEETSKMAKSLPRKARLFNTVESFPPSQAKLVDSSGDLDKVYQDDKRIIHTGPNPLHN